MAKSSLKAAATAFRLLFAADSAAPEALFFQKGRQPLGKQGVTARVGVDGVGP